MDFAAPPPTVITGNARLSRQLQQQFDREQIAAGNSFWEAPDILPREAWLRRCWRDLVYAAPINAPVLLTPAQELVLWEQAIAASSNNDILLDAGTTAQTALAAWKLLHAWELPRNKSRFDGLPDTQAFHGWMTSVEARLRDRNWITSAQLPARLAEAVEAARLAVAGSFQLAGFDELTPCDRRLFDAIGNYELVAPAPATGEPFQLRCESPADELYQAAQWARARLEISPAPQIAIVIRGLAAARTLAERIFAEVLHPGLDFSGSHRPRAFHISAGVPIAEVPLLNTALLLLRLPKKLDLADLGILLRSPYHGLAANNGAKLDAALRETGEVYFSLETRQLEDAFPALSTALGALPITQRPSGWSATFAKLLIAAGWPGQRTLNRIEYQAVARWDDLLHDLASLDSVLANIDYVEAVRRLGKLATTTQFAAEDLGAPVQIMDLLEAAGSTFDAVWLGGLHDRAWPQPAKPNPFLPPGLQREHNIPQSSPERELAYATRMTGRLFASAPFVVASYPTSDGTENESLRASPLIAGLADFEDAPMPATITHVRPVLEELADDIAPALEYGAMPRGGSKVLENQAACPFRAFATHRLNANPLKEAVTGISALDRGSIAHKALEILWKELGTQANLLRLAEDERGDLVRRSVGTALEEQNIPNNRLREVEAWRLERLLSQWLFEEAERQPFEVVALEQESIVELGGLRLRIKADRIDREPGNGQRTIVDYKTSKNLSAKAWEGTRPDAPQLPLYAATSAEPVAAVAFGQLVTGKTKIIEAPADPAWLGVVESLAMQFREGYAAVDPKEPSKTCRYCHLQPVCRVGDLTIEDEDANGD